MTTYYVSNTAANGIPVGDDAGGDGSAAHPWLTIDKANASIASGDTVYLNDGVYTPAAGSLRITTGSSWLGVTDYGATIAGANGQTRVIGLGNSDGTAVTFGKITIDCRNQALSGIVISDEPQALTLNMNSTRILNPVYYGVQGSSIATEANLNLTNVDFEATQALSMVYLPGLVAGNVHISGGTVNISAQGNAGYGGIIRVIAEAVGPTVTVEGVTANITAGAGAGAHYGIRLWNVPDAVIQNNDITINGADTSFVGEPISVAYDLSHPLDSSGGIIRYNKLTNNAYGGAGHLILVGYDGDPGAPLRNYANNFEIYGNVGEGNAQSQASTLHGVLVGWQSGATVYDNSMDYTAIAYVLKGMSGDSLVSGNSAFDTTVKSYYQKGGQNVAFVNNTSYNEAAYSTDRGIYFGDNGTGNGPASGGSAIGNTIYTVGQNNAFLTVDPGSSVNTIASNVYYAGGGTSPAGWVLGNSKYTTLAAWQAAKESTATSSSTFSQGVGALLGVLNVSGPQVVDEGIINGIETFEIVFDEGKAATSTFSLANLGRADAASLVLQLQAASGSGAISSADLSGSGVTDQVIGPIAGGAGVQLKIAYDGLGKLTGQKIHVQSNYSNTGSFDLVLLSEQGADPTLIGTGPTSITDKQTGAPFGGVTLSDPGISAVETVTVRADDPNAGQFVFFVGFGQNADGSLTFTGTPSAATTALRNLVFKPTENRTTPGQTTQTGFTVTIDDGAATIQDDTTVMTVTSVNDPASIKVNPTPQSLTDLQTITPFLTATVNDPDGAAQNVTVTVALDKASRGIFSTASGFTDNLNGTYTFVGNAPAAQAALRALVFVPATDQTAAGYPATAKITITATDGQSPVTSGITYLLITSANKAPVITPGATLAITDKQTAGPFRAMTVSDTNKGALETVTVTPTDATAGQFTTLAGFTLNQDGSISYSGTPGAATLALHGLVYTPTQNLVVPGQSSTVGFTVSANDGTITTTDAATALVVSSVNDSPTVTLGNTALSLTDRQTVSPFATATVADPDSAQTETVTITTNAPTRGSFTTLAGFTDTGNGSYSFTGNAAAASNALYQLVYTPTQGQIAIGKTGSVKLTLSISDGIAPIQSTAVNLSITGAAAPPNNPTVISTGAATTITDLQSTSPFATMTISDPDANTTDIVTVTSSSPTAGTFTNLAGFTPHPDGSVSFQGTPTQVTAALQGLVFTPTPNRTAPGTTNPVTFTVTANDGALTTTDTATQVNITSVNDAPVVVTAPPQPITDAQAATPFAQVRIIDRDVGATETVTVTPSDPAAGTFSNTGSFTNANGVLTFTGGPRDAALALRGLLFTPTPHHVAPSQTSTTTFTLTVSDGTATTTDSSTQLTVTALETPPSITLGTSSNTVSDQQTLTPFAGSVITDPDVGAIETVTVAADQTSRGKFTTLAGFADNGDGTYSITDTAAAVTAALQQLVFTPAQHQTALGGSVNGQFSITISDGLAPPTVATQGLTIVALADNAPTISAGAVRAISDKQSVTPFSVMTVFDADPSAQETVTVAIGDPTAGTFTNLSGFTNNGDGTVSIQGSPSAVTAALHGLTFTPAQNRALPGQSTTIGFTVTADDGKAVSTDTGTSLVVTSVNDAPTIALGAATGSVTDVSTIAPFASATITDPDPSQPQTVNVRLDKPNTGAFTTLAGFTDNGGGSYSFTGTASDATAALRALVFTPAQHLGPVGSSTSAKFTVSVSDGVAPSVLAAETLSIAELADNSPVLSPGAVTAITDRQTVSPFAQMTVSDPDQQTQTVTVVPTDPSLGSFTTLAGFTANADGSLSLSGSAVAVTAALQALVFTPAANAFAPGSTDTATFQVTVSDGTLSTTDSATQLVVSSLNDPPVLTLATAAQTTGDDQPIQPFATASIVDPDASQIETVTIALDKTSRGSFTTLAGFTDNGDGTYGITGTATAVTSAINQLVFTPAQHQTSLGGSLNAKFTVTVSDGIAPAVSGSEYVTIVATADTPPSIAGAAITTTVDNKSATPFKSLTIADPDASQSQTVTVMSSDPTLGSFAAITGATINKDGSVTLNGTPTQVTSVLHALTYVPLANKVAPGQSSTLTFTVTASDGVVTTSDNTSQLIIAAADDPPAVTLASSSQAITDQQTIRPFAGSVVTDADPQASETVTITLDKLTRGSFTTLAGFVVNSNGSIGFSGAPDAVTTALNGLVFTPAKYQTSLGGVVSAKLTLSVSDGIAPAVTTVDRLSITAAATSPPTITAGKTLNLTDKKTVAPFKSVSISDRTTGAVETVTVQSSNPAAGSFTGTSAFTANQDGSLTTSGTASQVTSALHGLMFLPTANHVLPGQTETATFTVTDNNGTQTVSDSGTKLVITSVNDAPTISLATTSQSITDQQTINPFAGTVIADPDAMQTEMVKITLDKTSRGAVSFLSGFTDNGNGSYSFAGTAADATSALNHLVFTPAQNQSAAGSSVTAKLSLSVSDSIATPVTKVDYLTITATH